MAYIDYLQEYPYNKNACGYLCQLHPVFSLHTRQQLCALSSKLISRLIVILLGKGCSVLERYSETVIPRCPPLCCWPLKRSGISPTCAFVTSLWKHVCQLCVGFCLRPKSLWSLCHGQMPWVFLFTKLCFVLTMPDRAPSHLLQLIELAGNCSSTLNILAMRIYVFVTYGLCHCPKFLASLSVLNYSILRNAFTFHCDCWVKIRCLRWVEIPDSGQKFECSLT